MPAAPRRHLLQALPTLLAAVLAGAWLAPMPVHAYQDAAAAKQATRRALELGAVVDARKPSAEGPRVMAVTPGGTAARLGLRAGDRLQAVNGVRLAGVEAPARELARALQGDAPQLDMQVVRDGQPVTLSGQADLRAVGGSSRCGQVTTTREPGDALLRVELQQVEGRPLQLPPGGKHALPVGKRVVIAREYVPPPGQRTRLNSSYQSRAFVLDVAPDTTYVLGGRPEGSGNGRTGWTPVVVRTLQEPCR